MRRAPGWMYPWPLWPDRALPLLSQELPSVHRTRADLIERSVREVFSSVRQPTAVDLACSEGWFAQRLLEWGAERVLGIDIRRQNIRRAELMRDHFRISPERLVLRTGDIFALDHEEIGTFDVVLLMGLIYHVEDPVGAVRRARAITRRLCVVESQLTRQMDPIEHGWGSSESCELAAGSFATRIEDDADQNPVASAGGVLSLVPNRTAFEQIVRVAGFSEVEVLPATREHNPQYFRGDRAVLLARP